METLTHELDINQLDQIGGARRAWQDTHRVVTGSKWDTLFQKYFNDWYFGNLNPNTGKHTLYRFLDLEEEDIETIVTKGLFPGAYRDGKRIRSFGEVAIFLEEAGERENLRDLINWLAGDREGISCNAMTSGSFDDYAVRQCLTANPQMMRERSYRITVELDKNEAVRESSFQPPELEWDVIGPIPPSAIVEIHYFGIGGGDVKDSKVIYKRD